MASEQSALQDEHCEEFRKHWEAYVAKDVTHGLNQLQVHQVRRGLQLQSLWIIRTAAVS